MTTNRPEFKAHDDFIFEHKKIGKVTREEFIKYIRSSHDHMRKLSQIIQQYDLTIDDYLNEWDGKFESFDDDVKDLLHLWIQDGTMDHIINENLMSSKADKTYVDDLHENITAQLAQTAERPIGLQHRNSALFDTNFEREGMVSFTIDDGYIEDLTHFKPFFESYGYKFTTFIPTASVGRKNDTRGDRMTWDQIREIYNAGHTVGSHTVTEADLTSITPEELDYELKESLDTLLNKGFDVRHITYPNGRNDEAVRKATEKYYLSGANITSITNPPGIGASWINRVSVLDANIGIGRLKELVDEAIDKKNWVIFYMHGYEVRSSGFMDKLTELVEYVKEKQVKVVTYDDGYDYFIRKKNYLTVGSWYMDGNQIIDKSVAHTTVDMPNFNKQKVNVNDFYRYNTEKKRIEFFEAGTYTIEYNLVMRLENGSQALVQTIFGAEGSGGATLSREVHQNFYQSQGGIVDVETGSVRDVTLNGYSIVSFQQGVYDTFYVTLPIRIKGQTGNVENSIRGWAELTNITITKLQ